MAAVERARSIASSAGHSSREQSLAAPASRQTSKGGVHSSTTSIASSDVHTDGATESPLEKSKTRNSDDARSETSSHRRRMSKLFKGRRRRRQSQSQEDLTLIDTHQSDDIPPVPDLKAAQAIDRSLEQQAPNQSEESLGLHKSVASSLLTQDSDSDSSPVRPGISPHHSHAGYLTLSSPLITSETVDADATGADSTTSTNTTPRHAFTIDVNTANKRGTSPVGKLKEAFTPTRRSTSPKPPPNAGDTDTARPSTSGGLGSLFGGKRRTDKVLDESTTFQASPPQLHQGEGTQSSSSLPSAAPRRIITQIPSTPPNLIDAPTTLVTPPTPTDGKGTLPTAPTSTPKTTEDKDKDQEKQPGTPPSNPNIVVSPSGNMISHRRGRSSTNPPSKLSNSISAPLTPTLEEAKTPGGTAVAPQQAPPSGFFSSVFSAAQNAATSLGTTIANSATPKGNKPGTQQQLGDSNSKSGEAGGEEVISPENVDSSSSTQNASPEKRRLAVETLGSGNLSLAQLGFTENNGDHTPMSSSGHLPVRSDEASAKAEDMAAAQAVSAAYAASKPPSVADDRPRSVTNASNGAASPPRQPEITDSPAPSSIQRQGSIRSRISGGRARRHRGSSATTGHTIAAGIGASTSTLAPQAVMSGQRLNGTGFAVAAPKRNREFHNLFKSVPEDDYLIEDYSAALQKEILLHGRLYISEGHLCFSSNILGWVTNLVISFDEVVSVEKKSTAVLFPNAIVIQTLHARNVFASFLSRDSTYDLIIGIWKISHPNLKSSLNGVMLDGAAGTGDKTEKAESIPSDEGSIQGSDDEVYDEDAEDDDGLGSFTEAGDGSVADSEVGSVNGEARKAAATVAQAVGGEPAKVSDGAEPAAAGGTAGQDFPGAATHAATDCGDAAQHYDKLLIDTTIPAPLGKVYSLMFGPASGVFMRKWLIEDQKSTELQMEDDKKGLGEDKKTFSFNYIKPLPGSIGPRQTKCITTMDLEQFDLDKAVSVLCSTQTPDVPSGSVFLTKTRYCLMWGPSNSTRLVMTFTVEWSGKSWLKGPIEKGANDGQLTYATSLSAALRTAVTAKAGPIKAAGKGGKGKKRSKAAVMEEAPVLAAAAPVAAQTKQSNWGLFEPIRSLLGPVADILESIFTPQITIFLLGALLIYTWYFRTPSAISTPGHWSPVQRQIAYEELWRHEESDLWKWLEERVALDRVHNSVASSGGGLNRGYQMQEKLVSESMQEREIDEAIRITEEKLGALKNALQRERDMSRTKSPKEESTK